MNLFYLLLMILFFLPTVVFYGWVAAFAWQAMVARRRKDTRHAATLMAIALAPCLVYAVQYQWASFSYHRVESIVANSQDMPKLANPPRILVVHGGPRDAADLRWQGRLVEMGAFDEVYLVQDTKFDRLTNERSDACRSREDIHPARTGFLVCATSTRVAQVPEEALHLYIGNAPRSPAGPLNEEGVPSRELRLTTATGQRMVGLWSMSRANYPGFPPILSWAGFAVDDRPLQTSTLFYDDPSFIIERLELPSENLKPRNLPSPAEVRAAFVRLRDSGNFKQQRLAGMIATSVGASALTADDVEPVMMSNAIDSDFGREIGFQQFCGHIDRLCDFQDRLIAVCKLKRTRDKHGDAKCDRLPQQCAWCKTAQLCRPYVTGRTAGCAANDRAARDASLASLRQD